MAFMFFQKKREDDKLFYVNDYDNYSLAGYNLIYNTWVKRGKPVNQGWTVTADELLRTYSETENFPNCNGDTYALVIDFHPGSKDRIGLIEINRIHIYTYSNNNTAEWSPLMLELSIIYYNEEITDFTNDKKKTILEKIEIKEDCEKIVEFLYLNGDDYYWNWGRNGMTNAVFLHQPARDFFRQFF